jgi:hypothetical protein
MCLITEQKEPIITEKDKIVYKTLTRELYATSYSFSYTIGVLYHQEIVYNNIPTTYMGEKVQEKYGFNWTNFRSVCKNYTNVHDGFHFFRTKVRAREFAHSSEVIVSCLIPKGSQVFYDKTGLGVTNQIKIIGLVKNKN